MSNEKALIERLREMASDKNACRYSIGDYVTICREAADEIEWLRKALGSKEMRASLDELKQMRAALRRAKDLTQIMRLPNAETFADAHNEAVRVLKAVAQSVLR
jgi:hypothetical protein